MDVLLVIKSYHHNNTEKIAKAFSEVLDAKIKTSEQINPDELQEYDLVGFGSGIYSDKHHRVILNFADNLPQVTDKKVFIFSTNGAPAKLMDKFPEDIEEKMAKDHFLLREKLQSKGYMILGEFTCPGHNTNSFLKLFGGINKGRPNAEDLKSAEKFALNLKQKLSGKEFD